MNVLALHRESAQDTSVCHVGFQVPNHPHLSAEWGALSGTTVPHALAQTAAVGPQDSHSCTPPAGPTCTLHSHCAPQSLPKMVFHCLGTLGFLHTTFHYNTLCVCSCTPSELTDVWHCNVCSFSLLILHTTKGKALCHLVALKWCTALRQWPWSRCSAKPKASVCHCGCLTPYIHGSSTEGRKHLLYPDIV